MPRAGAPPLPRLSRGDRRTGASTLNGEETKHARLAGSDPLESSLSRLIFRLLRRTLTQTTSRVPHARFSSGGKLPDTVTNPEWAKATAEKMKSWEREGAGPITLNPIKGGK